MNKFLLTMQYEEEFLLPIFLHHYAKYLPLQNIFIVDHGSQRNLVPAGCNRIFVPRTRPFSEEARLLLIRSIAQGLLKYYDLGIYADCDELISLDRFDETALQTQPEIYVAGFDVFWRGDQKSKKLLGLINPTECKPLIFSQTPVWSLGFHSSASCAPGALTIPMAHIRFLYKDEGSARLLKRMAIQEHMNSTEKKSNVAANWATGDEALNEFYSHVDRYDERQAAPEAFKAIDPQLIFTPVTRTLSDGREVVIQLAKSDDWKLMPDRYWNLSDQFVRLLDRESRAPAVDAGHYPYSFEYTTIAGRMPWKWSLP
jgi:hypothetical protein